MSQHDNDDEETPREPLGRKPRTPPRGISTTDANTLARAQSQAEEESRKWDRVDDIHLIIAEKFGRDGKGGEFVIVKATVTEHKESIEELITFKNRVLWTMSLLSLAGGAIVALAAILLERWLR